MRRFATSAMFLEDKLNGVVMCDMGPCNLQGFYRRHVFSSGSFPSFLRGHIWTLIQFFLFLS